MINMNTQLLGNENWIDIPQYEGLYLISNLGRIMGGIKCHIRKNENCKHL